MILNIKKITENPADITNNFSKVTEYKLQYEKIGFLYTPKIKFKKIPFHNRIRKHKILTKNLNIKLILWSITHCFNKLKSSR